MRGSLKISQQDTRYKEHLVLLNNDSRRQESKEKDSLDLLDGHANGHKSNKPKGGMVESDIIFISTMVSTVVFCVVVLLIYYLYIYKCRRTRNSQINTNNNANDNDHSSVNDHANSSNKEPQQSRKSLIVNSIIVMKLMDKENDKTERESMTESTNSDRSIATRSMNSSTEIENSNHELKKSNKKKFKTEDFIFIDDAYEGIEKNGFLSTRRLPDLCPICWGDFDHGEEVCWSPNANCKHAFHVECMMQWLMRPKDHCPLCRCNYLKGEVNITLNKLERVESLHSVSTRVEV